MHYGAFVILFVSALAGIGVSVLAEMLRGWGRSGVGTLMLGLISCDFSPKKTFTRVDAEALDVWLAEQPRAGALGTVSV